VLLPQGLQVPPPLLPWLPCRMRQPQLRPNPQPPLLMMPPMLQTQPPPWRMCLRLWPMLRH
jgi:hypothetical protein